MNKKYTLILGILLLILAMFVSACSAQTETVIAENIHEEADDHDEAENDHAEEDDHHDTMAHAHADPPTEFASLKNPFPDDHEAIEAGEETYNTLCATCHGAEGNGDGVAAEALVPKPASLADGMMMNELSDGYLFWRVSKGGIMDPFNSAMPPWETALIEEQRWQVISYVRTLADNEDEHHEESDHMENEMENEHMDDGHEDTDGHDD